MGQWGCACLSSVSFLSGRVIEQSWSSGTNHLTEVCCVIVVTMVCVFNFTETAGANVAVQLPTLLKWLFKRTSALFAHLFWQVMAWICFAVDSSPDLARASDDPPNLPVAKGPMGRCQRIPDAKKFKIAKIAARGRLFRSDRAVCEALHLLRGDSEEVRMVSSNRWVGKLAWQYLHNAQKIMKFGFSEPVYGFAWDATRLSKRDTLIGCLWNGDLLKAVWCPQQAIIS